MIWRCEILRLPEIYILHHQQQELNCVKITTITLLCVITVLEIRIRSWSAIY